MRTAQSYVRSSVVQSIALVLSGASAVVAMADVSYQSQTRQVSYEIACGDAFSSDSFDGAIAASDMGPFSDSLYLNVEWPPGWGDVEGRASADQASDLTSTQIQAVGQSHVHAFVQYDQTNAHAQARAESLFHVEFQLTTAAAVTLTGTTDWVRSTVDPPRNVTVSVTLYRAGQPVFDHARDYVWPEGVTRDDGSAFAFADVLPAGDYVLEIVAYTEAYSAGPWRQYAECTAAFDATMTISPPGDLDGDCDVDLTDLAVLLANFGESGGAAYADGDVDLDGDIDLTDLAILLAGFGATCA